MYSVFTWELNLFLPCFGLLALYSAYVLKPLIQPAAWHPSTVVLYSVRQGSVRFNMSEDESATCLFRSCCIIYLWYSMVYQSRIIPIWDGSIECNAHLNLWVWCMLSYPTVGGWGMLSYPTVGGWGMLSYPTVGGWGACYQPSANMYLWWWHGVDHGHGWAGHESPQQDHVQARGHYLIVRTTRC